MSHPTFSMCTLSPIFGVCILVLLVLYPPTTSTTPCSQSILPDNVTLRQSSAPSNFTLRTRTLQSLFDEVNTPPLPLVDKLKILRTMERVLPTLSPHRFLQLSIYKTDITAIIRDYTYRLRTAKIPANQSNIDFHTDMIRIFQALHDFHTIYVPPPPLSRYAAILPFVVREIFPNPPKHTSSRKVLPTPAYVLRSVSPDAFPLQALPNGSILLRYDNKPIHTYIHTNADKTYGSNRAARLARAVVALTTLLFSADPTPTRPFVNITVRIPAGQVRSLLAPWNVLELEQLLTFRSFGAISHSYRPSSLQLADHPSHHAPYHLLTRPLTAGHPQQLRPSVRSSSREDIPVREPFNELFSAFILHTKSAGPIGYLSFPSFFTYFLPPVIAELTRVLKLMPRTGLVVDVRGNVGGNPAYVKAVVELLSGAKVPHMALSLRSSELLEKTLAQPLTNLPQGLARSFISNIRFPAALRTARTAGEQFTGPLGNLHTFANSTILPPVPRAYFGPLVTVMDGLTYSGGDIFVVLQKDLGASLVVGTSDNTGAGGAGPIAYGLLSTLAPSIHKPLPGGVRFWVSVIRFHRTGKKEGALIEFFGVRPDKRYFLTLNDALDDDRDLHEYLGRELLKMKKQ